MQENASKNLDYIDLEKAAECLKANDYKVVRPFNARKVYEISDSDGHLEKLAILDVETTGTNFNNDKIIELGIVVAEYCPKTGIIFKVLETFNQLEDPEIPISEVSSKIHGITDDMVRGKKIDEEYVKKLISDVSVVIAHNASFDRNFAEKRFPFFKEKAWACSFIQVPWKEEGISSAALEFIAYKFGFHFSGHRASNDCHALLEIMHFTLPNSKIKVLKALLDNAFTPSIKLWAMNSGYNSKDLLKERAYRWNAEKKCWYRVISIDTLDEEIDWLRDKVYNHHSFQVEQETIDAYSRFSIREGTKEIVNFEL
jgi:DNA polymerase-3 subunit epsilon